MISWHSSFRFQWSSRGYVEFNLLLSLIFIGGVHIHPSVMYDDSRWGREEMAFWCEVLCTKTTLLIEDLITSFSVSVPIFVFVQS